MFTHRKQPRSWIGRRTALATGVLAALAIGAPVAEASVATPVAVRVAAVAAAPAGDGDSATGPTIIGSVFNGGTAVVTSPGSAVGTVVGSP